jgi:hypothetical protein
MKTTGIIFLIIGCLGLLGNILGMAKGLEPSTLGGALIWGVIGAFLISRANKKKEDAERKKQWEKGNSNNDTEK